MYSRLVYSCLPSTRLWLQVAGSLKSWAMCLQNSLYLSSVISDLLRVHSACALLIFSQEIMVSPSFSSRFSISTGSAIWSEYLLMMERPTPGHRGTRLSPSRRCRVISVPRSSLRCRQRCIHLRQPIPRRRRFLVFRPPREYARSLCQPR